jgi:hypothetical protein
MIRPAWMRTAVSVASLTTRHGSHDCRRVLPHAVPGRDRPQSAEVGGAWIGRRRTTQTGSRPSPDSPVTVETQRELCAQSPDVARPVLVCPMSRLRLLAEVKLLSRTTGLTPEGALSRTTPSMQERVHTRDNSHPGVSVLMGALALAVQIVSGMSNVPVALESECPCAADCRVGLRTRTHMGSLRIRCRSPRR